MPCNSHAGPQTGLFGQDLAHASPSRWRVSEKLKLIAATSGQRCSGSSESATLQLFLASRCQELLASVGSMEYSQTWKEKVTPAGRSYWAHTASGHRTSGKGYTGWPTAQVHDDKRRGNTEADCHHFPHDLSNAAELAGFPTPAARDFRDGRSNQHGINARPLNEVAMLTGWGTPRVTTNNGIPCPEHTGKGSRLEDQAALSGWATPEANAGEKAPKYHGRGNPSLGTQAESSSAEMASIAGYRLNPFFSLHLMGYPLSWGVVGILSCLNSKKE